MTEKVRRAASVEVLAAIDRLPELAAPSLERDAELRRSYQRLRKSESGRDILIDICTFALMTGHPEVALYITEMSR